MRTFGRAAAAILVLLSAAAAVAAKEFAWRAFDVRARLDASGALHVVETQTIVFDGDWNGGERTFRVFPGQSLTFEAITRVDPDGTRHPLAAGDLSAVDQYGFVGKNVLRWRSRMPSDPPFDHAERAYEIAYTLTGILLKQGNGFVLDHDFAFPDRQYPIQEFTLTLSLDPVWKPQAPLPERFESGLLPAGRGYVVRVALAYTGSGAPSVNHVPAAHTRRLRSCAGRCSPRSRSESSCSCSISDAAEMRWASSRRGRPPTGSTRRGSSRTSSRCPPRRRARCGTRRSGRPRSPQSLRGWRPRRRSRRAPRARSSRCVCSHRWRRSRATSTSC